MKKFICASVSFAFALVSCSPGGMITLPPDMTLVPGSDIPQQMATYISNALTQAAIPSATSAPTIVETVPPVRTETGSTSYTPSQSLYQSSTLGIQFSYPST